MMSQNQDQTTPAPTPNPGDPGVVSLAGLWSRFRGKISLTIFLVVAESALDILFPLFIGLAINGLLSDSYGGVLSLGTLGLVALIMGSLRRFYDTRAYAKIYEVTASELVEREQRKGVSISSVSARSKLLGELVEFFENSMPMIITSSFNLVGVLGIIATLNLRVFFACLALLVLVVTIYGLTGNRNFRFNQGYNDELERQVTALSSEDRGIIGQHFKKLMRWNIRLSDLETFNYAIIWLGVIALLVYAPIAVVGSSEGAYGFVFSILMYVFQYIDSVVALPLFIQQIIRLQEISGRLTEGPDPEPEVAS